MQNICALVERYRGKRSVLVAYSLGTGSAVVARMAGLARLAARSEWALLPGTQLALPGRRLHVLEGSCCTHFVVLDNGEEMAQCQRYSSRPALASDE
ncbi:hypothetical protein EMIT0158MI4_170023 [Burkholderia ambifaria]